MWNRAWFCLLVWFFFGVQSQPESCARLLTVAWKTAWVLCRPPPPLLGCGPKVKPIRLECVRPWRPQSPDKEGQVFAFEHLWKGNDFRVANSSWITALLLLQLGWMNKHEHPHTYGKLLRNSSKNISKVSQNHHATLVKWHNDDHSIQVVFLITDWTAVLFDNKAPELLFRTSTVTLEKSN